MPSTPVATCTAAISGAPASVMSGQPRSTGGFASGSTTCSSLSRTVTRYRSPRRVRNQSVYRVLGDPAVSVRVTRYSDARGAHRVAVGTPGVRPMHGCDTGLR